MNQQKQDKRKLTFKEKITIAGVTGLFAAVGAILGVAAYYQHWLG